MNTLSLLPPVSAMLSGSIAGCVLLAYVMLYGLLGTGPDRSLNAIQVGTGSGRRGGASFPIKV